MSFGLGESLGGGSRAEHEVSSFPQTGILGKLPRVLIAHGQHGITNNGPIGREYPSNTAANTSADQSPSLLLI